MYKLQGQASGLYMAASTCQRPAYPYLMGRESSLVSEFLSAGLDQWYTLGAALVAFIFRVHVPVSYVFPDLVLTLRGCWRARPILDSRYFYPGSHHFGLCVTSV